MDTLPPVINHKPYTYAELGTELLIQADIKDYSKINSEIIYSSGSKKINMVKSGNIYTGSIPAIDIKYPDINYYISASDAFGNTAYLPDWSGNPEFIKLEVKDTLSPVISHIPVSMGIAYMPLIVECIIRDNSGIVNAGLFFKGGYFQNYEFIDMVSSGGTYFAEIPPSYTVPGTLEYYIIATDGKDLSGKNRTGRSPESGTHKVQIHSEISSSIISLEISPATTQNNPLEIPAGESFLFKIIGRGSSGELLPADVIWVATGGIGNISQDGSFLATGRIAGNGLGKIITISRNLTEKGTLLQAETWVKITPGAPYGIKLNPESITIPAGKSQVFLCNITDRYNNPIEDNGKIIWKLDSKENIGEINKGIFISSKSGNGRIIASLGDIQSQSNINVTPGKLEKIIIQPSYKEVPAGSTAIFTATGYDAFSNIIPPGPIWSVRGGIGTVDGNGTFRGGKVGDGQIIATVGDISGTAKVKVTTGPLVSVTVSPYTAYLPVSTEKEKSTQQFIAEGWDVAGNPVMLKNIVWSTDALAGTISNNGLFTAVIDPGIRLGEIITNGSIWATGTSASGVSITNKGTAVIQKNPAGQLTSINVIVQGTSGEASTIYLTTGDVLKFEAVGSDSKGRRISIDPSWSVEGGIGRIDAHGFFTARMPGSGAAIATAGGLTGRINIEITLGALKSISINPNIMTLSPRTQGYVSAIGHDIYENVVPLRSLQWSIEGDGISIEPAGDRCLVKAKDTQYSGYSIISVSSGDIKAFANVIIPSSIPQLSTLSSQISSSLEIPYYLEIQPEFIDLKIGTQHQFQARAVDILGNSRELLNLTWSVIGNIGKISSSGAFQAGDKTSYGRIIVTDGKMTGIAIVRITASEINPGKLMVFPSQLSLASGALQKFTAFSIVENYITPVTPAWKVIGNVGKIDSRGLFTATFTGNGEIEGVIGSVTARCQIIVSSGLATKIELLPEKLATKAGNQQNFRVLCRDSSGNLTDSKPSFYLSDDIGTINSNALFS
ncbi:hypothetical protein FJZ33_04200, partial [Candidatus Poribacteria bacterium]|nr:hypothetical protein [Candidatus Poribacteria bacterium]